jgi:predicted GIY-YIG superfamily endonuclease
MKRPCVYIMASQRNGTLYVGVTSDLSRRAFEHRTGAIEGFSRSYGCKLLVWFESHVRMDEAIAREKQIKAGSRAKKLALVETSNPDWADLYDSLNAQSMLLLDGAALSRQKASDSETIQTKRPPQSPSLDRFALLAMTTERFRPPHFATRARKSATVALNSS